MTEDLIKDMLTFFTGIKDFVFDTCFFGDPRICISTICYCKLKTSKDFESLLPVINPCPYYTLVTLYLNQVLISCQDNTFDIWNYYKGKCIYCDKNFLTIAPIRSEPIL